jgi:ferric-dicitrate binding protein FerR (iron transport regulator)
VVLPDGSRAWLNASSSISFPVAFNPNKREVDISGEVYFEVSKMHIPFVVKYDKGLVQVLGTHFNIMAYHNEAATEVTLLEGSVKVLSGNANNILKPGQQAQLADAGEIKVADNVDVNAITAWKNGVFLFKNTEIETVMRQISRWYDVDVKYEGKMPHVQITGKISRNVNASEILSMLSYTGIHFKIEDKNIIITQ